VQQVLGLKSSRWPPEGPSHDYPRLTPLAAAPARSYEYMIICSYEMSARERRAIDGLAPSGRSWLVRAIVAMESNCSPRSGARVPWRVLSRGRTNVRTRDVVARGTSDRRERVGWGGVWLRGGAVEWGSCEYEQRSPHVACQSNDSRLPQAGEPTASRVSTTTIAGRPVYPGCPRAVRPNLGSVPSRHRPPTDRIGDDEVWWT
jgi:hypothetical protein